MDEKPQKEQSEARRQAQADAARVRAFQAMVASDGWKLLQELLNGRVEEMTAGLFERPKSDSERRGEDFDKGACFGLLWVRDLPAVTIAAFKAAYSEEDDQE